MFPEYLFDFLSLDFLGVDFFNDLEKATYDYRFGYKYILGKNSADEIKKGSIESMVIVDIDEHEINKLEMDIKYKVPVDAGNFIREFIRQAKALTLDDENINQWLALCKYLQKKYPVCLPKYWDETEYVNNYVFIDAVESALAFLIII